MENDIETEQGYEYIKLQVQKIHPSPGDILVFRTKQQNIPIHATSFFDKLKNVVEGLKKTFPLTVFLILPDDVNIQHMEIEHAKKLLNGLDVIRSKSERYILSDS